MSKHEVVFCIVNAGYSEAVMDSAREAGAMGGTVLRASGTANPQAERFFGLSIEPSKDMVMILIDSKIKENVLHNLYRDVGLKTEGQGIAFTLPVSDVVGLTTQENAKAKQPVEQVAEQKSADATESDDDADSATALQEQPDSTEKKEAE